MLPADVAKVADWAGLLEADPDPVLLLLATRLKLPMRLWALGLPTLLEDVAHAEFVSAAGRAEVNLAGRPKAILPYPAANVCRSAGAGTRPHCSPPPRHYHRYGASPATGILPPRGGMHARTATAAALPERHGGAPRLPCPMHCKGRSVLRRMQSSTGPRVSAAELERAVCGGAGWTTGSSCQRQPATSARLERPRVPALQPFPVVT